MRGNFNAKRRKKNDMSQADKHFDQSRHSRERVNPQGPTRMHHAGPPFARHRLICTSMPSRRLDNR